MQTRLLFEAAAHECQQVDAAVEWAKAGTVKPFPGVLRGSRRWMWRTDLTRLDRYFEQGGPDEERPEEWWDT